MNKLRFILKESFELPQALEIDVECGYSDDARMHANNFATYCQQNLQLPNLPRIKIVATRVGGMTTGAFDPSNNEILVLGGGRALIDVLRTLAHELTHYRQRLQDKIKSTQRDWNLEGEADAEAGKMVYTYAHASPENAIVYEL
jgi:hypothetical protein